MFKFLVQMIMTISAGAIVYVFAKALPRINDDESSLRSTSPHPVMVYIERLDEWLLSFIEKWLRRLRVVIMKFDNAVSKKLNRFKKEPVKDIS
ncbi:hypothetical protein HY967_03905, partial [Candidatus Jorgensenbacteria bacterium]|nr:hypothetical protein [Candidatus Jorgensenbacteria bacterium]